MIMISEEWWEAWLQGEMDEVLCCQKIFIGSEDLLQSNLRKRLKKNEWIELLF